MHRSRISHAPESDISCTETGVRYLMHRSRISHAPKPESDISCTETGVRYLIVRFSTVSRHFHSESKSQPDRMYLMTTVHGFALEGSQRGGSRVVLVRRVGER